MIALFQPEILKVIAVDKLLAKLLANQAKHARNTSKLESNVKAITLDKTGRVEAIALDKK